MRHGFENRQSTWKDLAQFREEFAKNPHIATILREQERLLIVTNYTGNRIPDMAVATAALFDSLPPELAAASLQLVAETTLDGLKQATVQEVATQRLLPVAADFGDEGLRLNVGKVWSIESPNGVAAMSAYLEELSKTRPDIDYMDQVPTFIRKAFRSARSSDK